MLKTSAEVALVASIAPVVSDKISEANRAETPVSAPAVVNEFKYDRNFWL